MASHHARKRFGQHFLTDESVIDAIVRAIGPKAKDVMVAIGQGLSALTAPLPDRLDHLTVVELDRDLAGRLSSRYSDSRLRVGHDDALAVDFGALGGGLRGVGNLPYKLSSPLTFKRE